MSVLDFLCCCRRKAESGKTCPLQKNSKQLLLDKLFAVTDRNFEFLRKQKAYFGGLVKGGYAALLCSYVVGIASHKPSYITYGNCAALAFFTVAPVMKIIEKRQELAEEEERKKGRKKSGGHL